MDFFSKWDQIRRKLRIWSHLLQKSIMENFIFCVVLRLKFSHLNEHKSNDCVSLMCKLGAEIETAKHLFLALLIPCQWKIKYPWQTLSDRSFNYKSWWRIFIKCCIQGCRERKAGGGRGAALPRLPPFSAANVFFHVNPENKKFLHVNKMWDFSLFIEQDISDKK